MLNNSISLKKPNLLVLCSVLTLWFAALGVNSSEQPDSAVFVSKDNPMAEVDTLISNAKAQQKLALLVLGANWCHDSRGLASNFAKPELAPILQQHYVIEYIDVGYYKDLRSITQRFGQAHYYATPTVMIIEPNSGLLLNGNTLAKWGAADSVPMVDYVEYFTTYANQTELDQAPIAAAYRSQITMFERLQAQRLMNAYTRLVPAMKAEDQHGELDEQFLQQWREVRGFRLQLQQDILRLNSLARSGHALPLPLPEYPIFSWEK